MWMRRLPRRCIDAFGPPGGEPRTILGSSGVALRACEAEPDLVGLKTLSTACRSPNQEPHAEREADPDPEIQGIVHRGGDRLDGRSRWMALGLQSTQGNRILAVADLLHGILP